MASCLKDIDEKRRDHESPIGSDVTLSHDHSHKSDEIVDLGLQTASHGHITVTNDSSSSSKALDSNSLVGESSDKSVAEESSSKSLAEESSGYSSGSTSQSQRSPAQDKKNGATGEASVHENSDEEYQSAEEGDCEYNSDSDTDEFIPSPDMLHGKETTETSETRLSDASVGEDESRLSGDSGEAGESEGEGVPQEDESETALAVDELEEKRKREESLTEEERQERKIRSQQMKDEGNVKFRASQYEEAIHSYTEALDLCPLTFHKERSIMFSNRAACKMKQDCLEEAIKDSTSALELHPHYLKALLRRAELYEKTEKLDEALKDYQSVLELDPSQHAVRATCMRLAEQIKDRNEKMKEEMIGKLKDLGNMVLRPFGLSVNNFNLQQDPQTGSYSMQFNQNPPGNGS